MKMTAAFFLAAATSMAAADPGRLVVIGDSITQATAGATTQNGTRSYRWELFRRLHDAGLAFGDAAWSARASQLPRSRILDTDILVPQLRLGGNEILHQADTTGVLQDFHRDATAAQQGFIAHEGRVFANHHAGNAVQQNGPAAHRAR